MDGDLAGRTVLVAGLGVSGSAAARALVTAGARVRAIDAGEGPAVAARVAELAGLGVDARAGVDFARAVELSDVDLVVPSPGLAQGSPLLEAASQRGLPVWSEPELAWRLSDGRTRLLVVTGTNGKTTTTELLGALVGAPTGGNIGTPLSQQLTAQPVPPTVVAELSSFQLRFTQTLRADVAVLLNLAPDHLDWHGGFAPYAAAKAQAWARSRPRDWLVVGDDPGASRALTEHPTRAKVLRVAGGPPGPGEVGVIDGTITAVWEGRRVAVARVDEMALLGRHNVGNACAAVAAALAAGVDPRRLHAPLTTFAAGPHRLTLVAEHAGVRWVDDSKATNPHAAAAALDATGASPPNVVWIAGGLGKGLTFEALQTPVRRHVRHALTIGTSGPQIAAMARRVGVATWEVGDLGHAVARAAALARPGDTVLLAPACASMDQFTSYAERGRVFAEHVAALGAKVRP